MLSIDSGHRLPMAEGRRWYIHQLSDLVWRFTKAEILPPFRARLAKDGERTATDLINKAYAKQPMRLTHARALLGAVNELRAVKGETELTEDDLFIASFFQIIHLDFLLRDIGMNESSLPCESGITVGLLSDLLDGARTTLFTALLVMRIINRVRHEQGKDWLDPRWYIRTDVKKDGVKLKVVAAVDSLVEPAPYKEWIPHRNLPERLREEDGPAEGQRRAKEPPHDDGKIVNLK